MPLLTFEEVFMNKITLDRLLSDKKNLERILDNLVDGIIAHDTERHIIFFNRAAEEITGYDRQELLGRDCHQVFGAPFCGGRCSFLGEAPKSLDHITYPLNIINKKGEPRAVEMSVSGMNNAQGDFMGVIASFRDVTDLLSLKIQLGKLDSFAGIIGRDPKMLRMYKQIREMATNDYPIHISGETGTGKELVATAIHNQSRRGGGAFVPVNCGALPEGILESELFGHVKGAFTGAVRDKKGRFELADGGTLFLDEIADLPKLVQVKILRVLQDGTFERVGDEKTRSSDVRIISAANRDIKQEVEKGNFRQDLYYRINVIPIHLPPLRDRKSDIPLLGEYFIKEAVEEGQEPADFSKEALELMVHYAWPGNVRELQSAVRFAMVRSANHIIYPKDLPRELLEQKNQRPSPGPSRKLDIDSVKGSLVKSGGNKAKAARILGVGRATLYRFLADFPDVT